MKLLDQLIIVAGGFVVNFVHLFNDNNENFTDYSADLKGLKSAYVSSGHRTLSANNGVVP